MKLQKVEANGLVTIPVSLRKKYGLTLGRKVKFEESNEGLKIIPLSTLEEINANIGFLGMKGKLLRALLEGKKLEKEF